MSQTGGRQPSAVEGARALYAPGYFAMPAFRAEQLQQLFREPKRRSLLTALDVVRPAASPCSLEGVREVLPYTDVLLPNNDEARALAGLSDGLEEANAFSRFNPNCTVAVTQGRNGVLVRKADEVLRARIFKVDSIDESGSGDALSAGFLIGLLENRTTERTLCFASALGASCTRALGCTEGGFLLDSALAFVTANPLEVNEEPIAVSSGDEALTGRVVDDPFGPILLTNLRCRVGVLGFHVLRQ